MQSACAENGEPPVILASSKNNKAITNILDCFARATLPSEHVLKTSILVHRWLPDLSHYGLYLPSKSKARELGSDHAAAWCEKKGQPWSGIAEEMETPDYLARAEVEWLAQFKNWSGHETVNIAEGTKALQTTLLGRVQSITGIFRDKETLLSLLASDAFPVGEFLEQKREAELLRKYTGAR